MLGLNGGRGLLALQKWTVRFDRLAEDSVASPSLHCFPKAGGMRASASEIEIEIAIAIEKPAFRNQKLNDRKIDYDYDYD